MLIFIDVETSGLRPNIHGVLSLGAVTETGEEFYEEYRLENTQLISPEALEVNGFNAIEIRAYNKDTATEGAGRFTKWVNQFENTQFAGWNVGFDRVFLYKYMLIYSHPVVHYHWLDVASYFQIHFGEYKGLHYACEYLNLQPEPDIHNALNGAKKVREVYYELLNLQEKYG